MARHGFGESYGIHSSPPILLPSKSQSAFQGELCLSLCSEPWRRRPPVLAFVRSLHRLTPPILLLKALARLCCSGCTCPKTLLAEMPLTHQFPPTLNSELKCNPPWRHGQRGVQGHGLWGQLCSDKGFPGPPP